MLAGKEHDDQLIKDDERLCFPSHQPCHRTAGKRLLARCLSTPCPSIEAQVWKTQALNTRAEHLNIQGWALHWWPWHLRSCLKNLQWHQRKLLSLMQGRRWWRRSESLWKAWSLYPDEKNFEDPRCLCVSVSKTPTTPTTRSLEPLLSETDRHASRHTSQVLTTHDRGSHKRAKSKIQGLLEESDGNLYCTQQWPKFSSPITSKHDTSQLQSRAGTLKPITSKYFPLYWGWTEQCEKIQDRKQEACFNGTFSKKCRYWRFRDSIFHFRSWQCCSQYKARQRHLGRRKL